MKNVLRKISTITRKAWEANPVKYNQGRDENIATILGSSPSFNVSVKISDKPF